MGARIATDFFCHIFLRIPIFGCLLLAAATSKSTCAKPADEDSEREEGPLICGTPMSDKSYFKCVVQDCCAGGSQQGSR